jgi:hypothetical protein
MRDRTAETTALRGRLLRLSAFGAAGLVTVGAAGTAFGVVALSGASASTGSPAHNAPSGRTHLQTGQSSKASGGGSGVNGNGGSASSGTGGSGVVSPPAVTVAPPTVQPNAGTNGS